MMTVDIETMGLMHHKPFPAMTCACLYDGVTQYQILFTGVSAVQHKANAAQLVALLDSAERLAGICCSPQPPQPTAKPNERRGQDSTLSGSTCPS